METYSVLNVRFILCVCWQKIGIGSSSLVDSVGREGISSQLSLCELCELRQVTTLLSDSPNPNGSSFLPLKNSAKTAQDH